MGSGEPVRGAKARRRLTEVAPMGCDDEEDASGGDCTSRYDRSNGSPFCRLQNFGRNYPDASNNKYRNPTSASLMPVVWVRASILR